MGKPTTKPTTTIVELAVWEISKENDMRKYDGVNSKAIVEKRVSWYVLRFFDTWNEQVTEKELHNIVKPRNACAASCAIHEDPENYLRAR